ncbi:hypothetical protein BDW74DRAFT_169539 [Aspergillus multicolor]|uniref:uncharacterized protein n=1 Tax=Aspergillus multicolor TaxID=41759 RepID=UPI003CCE1E85
MSAVSVKTDLRDAKVRDVSDVMFSGNSSTREQAATLEEARRNDIVVITAGSKYSLVVANPVDLLASLALRASELPPSRVLGSGTFLDSLRLRGLPSQHLYVLCVHGKTQVTAWSAGTASGIPFDRAFPPEALDPASFKPKALPPMSLSKFGCCFSSPMVFSKEGIIRTIDVLLDIEKEKEIAKSADELRATLICFQEGL